VSSIDEIKARINIIDLVSETVQLRRTGKNYTGFCPFHSNTRTPAFVVFADTGTWRCFGQCNEGGDIFRYVMKKEGWDFNEALKYLADRAGVQLRPPTPQEQEAAEEHDRLRQLLEEVVVYYRHQMTSTPAGQEAQAYLVKRGLRVETIETWGLGYAPLAWEAVKTYFISKGYSEKELLEAGLVTERDSGGAYDKFRHRIMFPIRDERGRMAGFGARILNPDDVPKFMNSPQTPVFDKGHLLYGLDRARRDIRILDQVVIVEGYLDVIALHQAGFANAVSPMGTALTEHQLYLIKRFTRRIVLALDPDAAGAKATMRGLEIARQAMDRTDEVVFDARGLLGHEARLQADIRVTTLPEGKDPDDVVNADPKEWERILQAAKPVVIHVMETLANGQDLDDPKIKSQIAGQVIPLIEDVPDAIERDTYRQRLARVLRVDERTLLSGYAPRRAASDRQRLERPRRTEPSGRPSTGPTPGGSALTTITLESRTLGVLMRRPDLLHRVDRVMQEFSLPRLSISDFQRAENQIIFQLVLESLEQDLAEPLSFVLNGLDLPMMEWADVLLVRTEKLDPVEDRVLEELLRDILQLRKIYLGDSIDYYRFQMEDLQQTGDSQAGELAQRVFQHTQVLLRLDKALARFTSRTAAATHPNA
jgi:DNA primase